MKKIVKTKSRPSYLVVYIGPLGPDWLDLRFHKDRPSLSSICRGEGTALSFKLDDYDHGGDEELERLIRTGEMVDDLNKALARKLEAKRGK